jgi:hypothetical protein
MIKIIMGKGVEKHSGISPQVAKDVGEERRLAMFVNIASSSEQYWGKALSKIREYCHRQSTMFGKGAGQCC